MCTAQNGSFPLQISLVNENRSDVDLFASTKEISVKFIFNEVPLISKSFQAL